MKSVRHISAWLLSALVCIFVGSCSQATANGASDSSMEYAGLFDLQSDENGCTLVVSISPYDGSRDTLKVSEPLSRIICMSTTHVACLDAVGCDSVIVGASGLPYLTNERVKSNAIEIGYDPVIDYEAVLSARPDLFVAYSVSEADPQYVRRLRSLGVPVLLISDHLEQHPLARAEYVKLFGALVGRSEQAQKVFSQVRSEYNRIAQIAGDFDVDRKNVLVNIPYSGEWFVPGGENYTSRLIDDAGGMVLGSVAGQSASSVMSMEQALLLSADARVWLNPGWCRTREDVKSVHPLFSEFGCIGGPIYNNTLRENSEGGNDFWESGAVHPERILSDLATILHPELYRADSLYYYIEVK